MKAGLGTGYDRTCLHLPKEQAEQWASEGRPHIIRLQEPSLPTGFEDLIFGPLRGHRALQHLRSGVYDDIVLLKANGRPTYHLANVVDDHHMEITHVIRGVEWLISTQKHVNLYNAFGWSPPIFAHVGLLLDAQKQKLSKRDQTFDLASMKEDGLLPDALNNFLVLLGWNPGGKKEFMTMSDMETKVSYAEQNRTEKDAMLTIPPPVQPQFQQI